MNQHSLVQHYNILKTLKEISHAIYLSESNDIPFRIKWDLMQTYTDEYVLFCTKKSSALQLVRINKERKAGYTIAKFEVSHKNYYNSKNSIYKNGKGFNYNGDETTIQYVEPGKKEAVELDCLPVGTVRNLLLDEGLEELEFQYGTLHNFDGDSFEMYSIFSLLHNVDEIDKPIADQTINRLSFLDVVGDNVVDSLLLSLTELKNKIVEDLSNA